MAKHGPVIRVLEKSPSKDVALMSAFACDYCKHLSIATLHNVPIQAAGNESEREAILNSKQFDKYLHWLPRVGLGKKFPDVEEHIAQAASEAYECYSIGARRASAILARAVIEATAKAKGITKGTIAHKIDELFTGGYIRAHIRDGAHEVRYLGNDMAHGDFVDVLSQDEAELALTLMTEVLEEVFQSPARVKRARDARTAKNSSNKP